MLPVDIESLRRELRKTTSSSRHKRLIDQRFAMASGHSTLLYDQLANGPRNDGFCNRLGIDQHKIGAASWLQAVIVTRLRFGAAARADT
ncbi:hypothetical protein [Mesorhizobium sp. 65-26]|jgi:hypothetical protein|uniref:hypothetical protein n=1 Tax=Mesorhizobium sp. 65-26 TaxID=1895781 RepID=UPI0025D081EC|nr:hypothetical protein [Mesorhizobium sp. 65-26]